MAEQITKQDFSNLMEVLSNNFKFKMPDGFEMIFNMIFDKIKHLTRNEVQKKFEQLLLTSNEEWHRKYGFAGYPALSDWINILVGESPLTDAEKLEANRKHEEKLRIWVGTIIVWITDQNLDTLFKNKYKNEENRQIVNLIDKYGKKANNDEEISKLGRWLKSRYEADKTAFKAKLKGIAEQQNPAPFTIEFKPKETNIIQLPILKKINFENKNYN